MHPLSRIHRLLSEVNTFYALGNQLLPSRLTVFYFVLSSLTSCMYGIAQGPARKETSLMVSNVAKKNLVSTVS